MTIHGKQNPEPAPRVTIIVPATTNPRPTGSPPEAADPPVLPGRDAVAPREEVPRGAEYTPMRISRLRTIWGLIVMSLVPGIVAALAPGFLARPARSGALGGICAFRSPDSDGRRPHRHTRWRPQVSS